MSKGGDLETAAAEVQAAVEQLVVTSGKLAAAQYEANRAQNALYQTQNAHRMATERLCAAQAKLGKLVGGNP